MYKRNISFYETNKGIITKITLHERKVCIKRKADFWEKKEIFFKAGNW